MSYVNKLFFSVFCMTILGFASYAQPEDTKTIDQQFQAVMDETESFKKYKVVPRTTLIELSKQVGDSLQRNRNEIDELQSQIITQQDQISQLENQLQTVTSDLNDSKELNETISFLGIDFQKPIYNVIVWGIIILLLVALAAVYMMFNRSNKITRTTRNDLKMLTDEFDTYKTKSQEKQIKLKRDLQTAMNTLHEKGFKV
ncbi:MAG: hypothetical protein WBA74_11105 [Cyclobacteriaceae bacterium]